MPHVSVKELRDSATLAHRRGDTATAIGLYEKILDLFPDTIEAIEAVFYLSSIGKGPRRPARRVAEELPKRGEDSQSKKT
jgi:hypothetical protein